MMLYWKGLSRVYVEYYGIMHPFSSNVLNQRCGKVGGGRTADYKKPCY